MERLIIIVCLAIVLCSRLTGQTAIQEIETKYDQFQKAIPKEYLYLSTAQDKYIPGDTIYYNAYLFNADYTLTKNEQTVHLALINNAGAICEGSHILVKKGVEPNKLIIPDTISEGFYKLVAYTDWQRNFGKELFFQKEFPIVTKNKIQKIKGNAFGIEGANLVDGIESNLVVKTHSPRIKFSIQEGNGKSVLSGVTDGQGYVKVHFIPSAERAYYLLIEEERIPLPTVKDKGVVINLSHDVNGVSVNINKNHNSKLHVLISSSNAIQKSFILQTNSETFRLSDHELEKGINWITVLSEGGEVVGSRPFFVNQNENPDFIKLNQNTNGSDGISVSASLQDRSRDLSESMVSMKIINKSLGILSNNFSMFEELSLSPFIDIEQTIGSGENIKSNYIDNELIISNIKDHYLSNNLLKTSPLFEKSNLLKLSGKAKDTTTSEYLEEGSVLLTFLYKNLMVYQVLVGEEGKFTINLSGIYGKDELFYMANDKRDNKVDSISIEWGENTWPELEAASLHIPTNVDDPYAIYKTKVNNINKSFSFYSKETSLDSLLATEEAQAKSLKDYLVFDDKLNADDFILFPTMAEFIDEVVRPLRVRKEKGVDVVRFKYLEGNEGLEDPVYIIDGQITNDTEYFLSISPQEVQTISVVKYPRKLSRYGIMGINGIIYMESKNKDLIVPSPKMELPLSFSKSVIEDLALARTSVQPQFVSTLAWFPKVELDETYKLTLSDDPADWVITVEGFVNGKFVQYRDSIHR